LRTGRLEDPRAFEIEAICLEDKNWTPRRPGDQNMLNPSNQLTIGLTEASEDLEFGGKQDRRTKGPKDGRTRGQQCQRTRSRCTEDQRTTKAWDQMPE